MSCQSNPQTVAHWQDRIDRYLDSDLTVAAFCLAERISTPAFYSWKKRLSSRDFLKPKSATKIKAESASAAGKRVSKSATAASAFEIVQLSQRLVEMPTIVRIGSEIEIELGTHAPTVELITTKLLQAVTAASRLELGHTGTHTPSAELRHV